MALAARIRRGLKGGAKATTLNGSVAAGANSIVCTDLSTWAGVTTNGPSTATINRDASDEETVGFTGISGNTLTGVTRGEANTTDQAHTSGTIELTTSKIDADEANELVAATASNSVRVRNASNIAVATGTEVFLTFDTELFDTGAMHSTSSNTGRLTCVKAGKYLITGTVIWGGNPGDGDLFVRLNGTTLIAGNSMQGATGNLYSSVTTIYDLAVNDYVELGVRQNSGGSVNITASGPAVSPAFAMAFIGF